MHNLIFNCLFNFSLLVNMIYECCGMKFALPHEYYNHRLKCLPHFSQTQQSLYMREITEVFFRSLFGPYTITRNSRCEINYEQYRYKCEKKGGHIDVSLLNL